jgi:hypothetical protein
MAAGSVGTAGRDITALTNVLRATYMGIADRWTAVYDRASSMLLMLR